MTADLMALIKQWRVKSAEWCQTPGAKADGATMSDCADELEAILQQAKAESFKAWICYDCDHWWLKKRETCQCGEPVMPVTIRNESGREP